MSARQSTINTLLSDFGANFSIVDARASYVGREPNTDFAIAVGTHKIKAGEKSPNEPSFKTVLSAGHFNSRYIAAMDRLAPLLDGAARINMALRLVQTDMLREVSHRQLMDAYLASGEKAQALRQYEKLRKLLREELGVERSPETQMLRDRISATGNGVSPAAPPHPTISLLG